jgi:hypothetical protein
MGLPPSGKRTAECRCVADDPACAATGNVRHTVWSVQADSVAYFNSLVLLGHGHARGGFVKE